MAGVMRIRQSVGAGRFGRNSADPPAAGRRNCDGSEAVVSSVHPATHRKGERGTAMRIARFEAGGRVSYGLVEGDSVTPVERDLFGSRRPAGDPVPLSSVRLLAPVVPRLMLATALNYPSHRGQNVASPRPELFVKGNNCLSNPGAPIVMPAGCERVDYEGELVVGIGRRCSRVSVEDGLSCVLGYTCGNDVSARD